MNDQILTIEQLFKNLGLTLHVYDVGRVINLVEPTLWHNFEQQDATWPTPFQRHAWVALLGVDAENKASVAWFIKLELDELGELHLNSRDDFVRNIIAKLGANLEALNQGQDQLEAVIKDIPQAFEPSIDRRARFHALATHKLGQQPSEYYQGVVNWLQHPDESWQQLGLQGFADLAVRSREPGMAKKLSEAIAIMPIDPLMYFCQVLEGEDLQANLLNALEARIYDQISGDWPAEPTANLLRGIAGCPIRKIEPIVEAVLRSSHGSDAHVIATISGRLFGPLSHPAILQLFLDRLEELDSGNAFIGVISELLTMHSVRPFLLAMLHAPDLSPSQKKLVEPLFRRN